MVAPVLSQHARLISIETAQGSFLPESLVVESFTGVEAVNAPFVFDIQALSPSAFLDLSPLQGEEVTLRLLLADHSLRVWHGYCHEAGWAGADGGLARYHLQLTPFVNALAVRQDTFLFQNKNAYEIVAEVLAEYPQANLRWECQRALKVYPTFTQYRESDYDFLMRLLALEGLSYRFEHLQGEAALSAESLGHAKHCWVIFDVEAPLPALPAQPSIRFHGVRASEAEDSIHQWALAEHVQSNACVASSWHEGPLVALEAEVSAPVVHGEPPALPLFMGSGLRRFDSVEEAALAAHTRLLAHSQEVECYAGRSGARALAAGFVFELLQHEGFVAPENRFLVRKVHHRATNNFVHGVHQEAGVIAASAVDLFAVDDIPIFKVERGVYRNQFEVTRYDVPVLPKASAQVPFFPTLGPQAAVVVGFESASITTERNHRVKVQFVWQRGLHPVAGGLFETGNAVDTQGNAPLDERSGAWVRVSEALAGPNWGSQFVPRIGAEVLVEFAEADADVPVMVAAVFNQQDTPPFRAGIDSGVNHAGVVSGWHSQGLDGQGFNQWVLDDTQGQLRMRFASSVANSQLSLGYLVQQSPFSAQRGAFRGEGFELRTNAWGVLRGQEGVLISSSSRAQWGASVCETQMDMREAVQGVMQAQRYGQALTRHAQHQQVLWSAPSLAAVARALGESDAAQQGHYVAAVNGQAVVKPAAGGRALAGRAVERLAQPWVVVDSASGVHWASASSSMVSAGAMLFWATQADVLLSAGGAIGQVSGAASSWLSAKGGLHATAAHGPLTLRAHSNAMQLWGDKQLAITSTRSAILIKAKNTLKLKAGQSALTLQGAQVTFACLGKFTVKTGQHGFRSAGKVKPTMKGLPRGGVALAPPENPNIPSLAVAYDEAFILKEKKTGKLLANTDYRIKRANGQYEYGRSDSKGHTHLVNTDKPEELIIEVLKA